MASAPQSGLAGGAGGPGGSSKEPGLRYPSNGKTIYHRPLNRTKTAELSQASFAYLFGEMVTYAQRQVKDIQELEQKSVLLLNVYPVYPCTRLTHLLR
jgi:hypothetical protein